MTEVRSRPRRERRTRSVVGDQPAAIQPRYSQPPARVISDDEVLAHARDKTRFEDLSLTFKSSPRKRKAMMKEFQKKQARRTR